MENVPHPDRISTQRTHVLPNDAADIDKKDKLKTKSITKTFKDCITGGAHRLGKMRKQTTKAVRHTSTAVKNVVSHGIQAKTDDETLNIVVETRKENNMQWADESNTLGLLNNANDTSFEQLWRETKGPQRDLTTKTPVMTLDKTFENAYGLHREDDYFYRLAAANGSPYAKPSFSLMLADLSTRDTSVAVPPVVDESVMSVYIEEPTERGTELTDSALKKHDESIDSMFHSSTNKNDDAPESKQRASSSADNLIYSPDDAAEESIAEEPSQDTKYVLSMEDYSMNQSIYKYSFVQPDSYVTNMSEERSPVQLMGELLPSEDSPSVFKGRVSLKCEPDYLKNLSSQREYDDLVSVVSETTTESPATEHDQDNEVSVESMKPEFLVESTSPECSASGHETEDIVSIVSDAISESPVTEFSERLFRNLSLESEHHESTLGDLVSTLSDMTSQAPTAALTDHQDRNVSLVTTILSSQQESEESALNDLVCTLTDTTSQAPTTALPVRKVSFGTTILSSPQESEESALNDLVCTLTDTTSQTPTTALPDHQDKKIPLETTSLSSPQESEACSLGDLVFTLGNMTSKAPTAASPDHQDRKISLDTTSLSSPQESEESTLGDLVFTLRDMASKAPTAASPDHQERMVSLDTTNLTSPQESEDVGSIAMEATHKEPMPELSEESLESEALFSRRKLKDLAPIATGSEMSRNEPKVQSTHATKEGVEKRHRKNPVTKILRGKMTRERFPKITGTRGKTKDNVCETKTTDHEPTGSEEQFRKSNLVSRPTDDAESFSSESMSLKVTESAPSVLETIDFKPAVYASPKIVKHSERKSTMGLASPSVDYRRIATSISDRNELDVTDVSELDASFLAPVTYSPSADSVASSAGSPLPLVSDQALSNAAFLFSPSYAGGEFKLLPRANSPRAMNLSTFAINTAESRGRLSTFSARSRPAFSIPVSSAPNNMSSIRPSRSSYSDDAITYSRPESCPPLDNGIQKHVHFSNFNDVFVLRESNKARVAMGTPVKVVSPVIENKVSDLTDTGIPFLTSTASDPSPPLSRGLFEESSPRTINLEHLHEVKAGDGDLEREDDSGVESPAQDTSNMSHREEESLQEVKVNDGDMSILQEDDSIVESTAQNTSRWSYREEDGVLCAATPLRANGRSVQHRPSLAAPANSPMIRFREAKIKFSSQPVAKVPIRESSPRKSAKPSVEGAVHSRVTELNSRLRSNRQLVRKNPRRETGGENAIAPRPATLMAPLFPNPAIMSYKDGTKSGPKYSIESQSSYEGMSDTGVSTVVSGDDEAERKPKYSTESQSTYEGKSDTGVSTDTSGEDEAEHKPKYSIDSSTYEGRSDTGVSTVASGEDDEVRQTDVSTIGVDKDIFAKMMGSPEESSCLDSEDEDDPFADIMKKSSPSFDDRKLDRTFGITLKSLLSQDENKSMNQQPPRPRLSRGPIGTSLRSLVSEDPSALTFDTNKENSSLGPRTLSFADKAKVNPREQQHRAPHGALCLSPLQRTPMQARKWRTLAAAAKKKDRTKKGSSKKQSGLRERSSNAIY
jgi:hypothetical protein